MPSTLANGLNPTAVHTPPYNFFECTCCILNHTVKLSLFFTLSVHMRTHTHTHTHISCTQQKTHPPHTTHNIRTHLFMEPRESVREATAEIKLVCLFRTRLVPRVHARSVVIVFTCAYQSFSREINYQLFPLSLVYIYRETEYVRVFSYVSYVLEKLCA